MRKKKTKFTIIFIVFLILSVGFYLLSTKIYILKNLNYNENGNVSYKVYLNDNKYYGTEYLNEGMKYITKLIDNVDLTFNYNASYDKEIKYTTILKATAELQIVDPDDNKNVIYNFKENLQDEKIKETTGKNINISKNLKIDYQKYNKLVNEFKSTYGISADTSLKVTYLIYYTGSNDDFENIDKSKTYIVNIPLSEQTISISKSQDFNDNLKMSEETNKTTSNKLFMLISIISFIISIISGFGVIINIVYSNKRKSIYQKELDKILKHYDSYITESSSDVDETGKTVVNIKSFKELLDVRKNIEKAIIFVKIDNSHSKFIIVDEDQIYKFIFEE